MPNSKTAFLAGKLEQFWHIILSIRAEQYWCTLKTVLAHNIKLELLHVMRCHHRAITLNLISYYIT